MLSMRRCSTLSTRRPARQMPTMLPLPLLPPPYEPPPMPPPPPLAARTPELSGPCYKPPPRPPPRHLHCQPRRVPLRHMCGGEGGHLAGHGDREAHAGLETSSRESNTPIQQPTAPRAQGQSTLNTQEHLLPAATALPMPLSVTRNAQPPGPTVKQWNGRMSSRQV